MKHFILPMTLLLSACAGSRFAPPPAANTAGLSPATAQQLNRGRQLFASRCLECHTLPDVHKYSCEHWPHLVSWMAPRANLKAEERDAIIAYLQAASR